MEEEIRVAPIGPSIMTAIFCLLVFLIILVAVDGPGSPQPPPKLAYDYSPAKLCADASEQDRNGEFDHSKEQITRFELMLGGGCWSGWVTLPAWWRQWDFQLAHEDDWVAGWHSGSRPVGPFRWNQPINFCTFCPNRIFRLQGHGTVTVYTNEKGPPSNPSDAPRNGEPVKQLAPDGPPPHEQTSPPGTAKMLGDFLFTLGTCKLEADRATCDFIVTNRAAERKLEIEGRQSFATVNGYDHHPSKVTLGSEQCDGMKGLLGDPFANAPYGCTVSEGMPQDVARPLTVTFDSIPSGVAEISYMEIDLGGHLTLKFYGIPLTK